MDDGDETGSSTKYSTVTGSETYNEEDGSSRNSSLDHFDVDPETIKRRMSRKNSESEEETDNGSSSIGSFKINDDHNAACRENKTRVPIIEMASFSSESSSDSDASSEFDLGTRDRSHGKDAGGPVVISPGAVFKAEQLPPTQFPPVQIMQRSEGYEPNRIPSSVFQRNTSDVHISDWSVASNESLFSIHVGNNHSFSREQAAMIISSEIHKSGAEEDQVVPPKELFSFTPPRSEQEPPTSPTAFPAVEPREQKADKEDETTTPSLDGHQGDSKKAPTVSWKSSSRYSEKSDNSSVSFAFPI
ncbi:hypothetical protein LINGRAHAP2_LOCUS37043 [Linum grandiflorum]